MLKTPGFSGRLVRWGLFGALLLSLFGLTGPTLPAARADTVFDIPNGDIAAFKAALATPGTNIINLASNGVYTLTTVDSSIYGPTGLPIISNTVTVNGHGSTLLRDSEAAPFRFFWVSQIGNLTLNNLTLFNGYADPYNGEGGAAVNAGTVELNYTTFYSNTSSGQGGAIFNLGAGFSDISTPPNQSYTATLRINYSTFISNSAGGAGGAIFSEGIGGQSTISNTNPPSNGTGILKIQGSSFISNTSFNAAVATIGFGSQQFQNYKTGVGTAIAEISNSTFAHNQATYGSSAILNHDFSYNDNTYHYGPGFAFMTVTNSTIVSNTFRNTFDERIGAIYSGKDSTGLGTATTSLRNNIIASNGVGNCYDQSNSFVDDSNNLEYGINGPATCGTGSTVVTTNPVASLIPNNNGGPTLTTLPAGPAIDGGNNAICTAAPVNNYDQRGYSRPIGAACDVGAVESGGKPVVRNNSDTGDSLTVGSLSFYLKYATNGQPIGFALPSGQTITVSGPLPPLLPNIRVGTGCDGVTVLGTGVPGDGLTLKGNNVIRGVAVRGFGGRQIVTAGTGNQLVCTKASKI